MRRGRVIGEVWATRKAAGLAGRSLKVVALEATVIVALDTLDARVGQDVLVAMGSGGRNVVHPGPHNRHVLCDAAIALLIDPDPGPPAR